MFTAGLLVFSTGWSTPFVLDAVNKIESNPDIRSREFRPGSFFDAYTKERPKGTHLRNDPSRPLTYMTYWVLWQMGGGSPWPFHVLATLIHIAAAFLLGRLALRLGWPPAGAVAASFLFLVLPLNAGSVLYPFALSDLLAAFFTLIILNLATHPSTALNLLSMLGCFVLALAAKQSAVVIPPLVFVVNPAVNRRLIALVAATGVFLALRFWYFGGIGDLEAENTFHPLEYFLIQGAMIWKYLRLTLIPSGLAIDHNVKLNEIIIPLQLAAWFAIALIAFLLLVQWRRKGWSLVPPALFLLPLLPTSFFFPTTDLFVERRAYLATAGVVLAVGLLARWKLFIPLAAVAFVTYGALSVSRALAWSSAENIYQEVLRLYPADTRSLNNLATIHIGQGKFDAAKTELETVLKLDGRNIEALANLGALHQLNQTQFHSLDKALALYRQALDIDPNHLNTLRNLGFLYLSAKQIPEAKAAFSKALELNPRLAIALAGLGKAEQMSGNFQAAAHLYKAALAEEPNLPLAREELARLPQ